MSIKTNTHKIIIHVVNTYKKPKVLEFLLDWDYGFFDAYGKFWVILERITEKEDFLLPLNELPDLLKVFADEAIKADLFQLKNDSLYSTFLNNTVTQRLQKRTDFQTEIQKLKDEIERLQKLLKLKVKK